MNEWMDAEQHVERAHEAYEAGRLDEAESELRRALSLNPERADWHFNLGLTLEAAGRWSHAVEAFQDAHRLNPRDSQSPLMVGINFLRAENAAESVKWLDRAMSLGADRLEAMAHLIDAHARLNDHDRAEELFYQALHHEGDHALVYANMAESLLDRNLHEKAIHCLREALSRDPAMPRIHARLGYALARTGRQERARQLYLRELRDNPGDIDALIDLAHLLSEMNRFSEAGEKLRRVLELESDCAEAHFMLADLAERQGRTSEALAGFNLVLKLEADYPGARRRLGALLLAEGRLPEARRELRRELRDWRADPSAYPVDGLESLGRLLLDVRLPEDAARVLSLLVEREPQNARAWHALSVAQFRAGDRATGAASCTRALRLNPKSLPALHNMALACVQAGEWRRAQRFLRRALAVDPEDAGLHRLRLTLRLRRAAAWVFRRPGARTR